MTKNIMDFFCYYRNFKKNFIVSNTVLSRQRKIDLKIKAFELIILKELGKIIL